MKHRSFYDTQRAQPTLRLHSSCFVVESCDVFVGNQTLFEQFGNISSVLEPNESFWSSVDRFSEFCQDWNPVCTSSPSERNRVCVGALLVVWSDLSERARKV